MKVTALEIRQSFGKVLSKLYKYGKPIIIEKNREPVAVLISIELFKKRFVDYQQLEMQEKILQSFKDNLVELPQDSLEILRELRYGGD